MYLVQCDFDWPFYRMYGAIGVLRHVCLASLRKRLRLHPTWKHRNCDGGCLIGFEKTRLRLAMATTWYNKVLYKGFHVTPPPLPTPWFYCVSGLQSNCNNLLRDPDRARQESHSTTHIKSLSRIIVSEISRCSCEAFWNWSIRQPYLIAPIWIVNCFLKSPDTSLTPWCNATHMLCGFK